jgi:small conductance mechanosensitive channel
MSEALDPVSQRLQEWSDYLLGLLPNLAVALAVLLLAWVIGLIMRRLTLRLAEKASVRVDVARLLGTSLSLTIVGGGLFIALGVLGLDRTVTSLLAGAGVAGLAIGFAAQNLASNVISGTVISLRRPYKEGDLVATDTYLGTVERIDLRLTQIKTADGQLVLIPNKDMLEKPLINYSTSSPRRVDLDVGVSYTSDLERVREVAIAAVESVGGRQTDAPVEFYYREFGGSSIDFVIRFWLPGERQADYLAARSEAIIRIKKAFDAAGISIPFPIRTIDLGTQSAMTLAEAMKASRPAPDPPEA